MCNCERPKVKDMETDKVDIRFLETQLEDIKEAFVTS